MTERGAVDELAALEHGAHRPTEGLWRPLYVEILRALGVRSVLDLGAGSPELLAALEQVERRVAVDSGDRWREAYCQAGVDFHRADLNSNELPAIDPVEAVVCTDVLEHLLFPRRVLHWIAELVLAPEGVLITHVPNEFTLRRTVAVMLGRRDAVYYHPHLDEDDDPHLRRFTDLGLRRFLLRAFPFNEGFSHLNFGTLARTLQVCRVPVPFCLQPGPGYVSTRNAQTHRRVREVLAALPGRRARRAGKAARP